VSKKTLDMPEIGTIFQEQGCIEHARTQAESRKNLRAFLTVLERYVS
jgi:hypothetical protein